MRFLFFLALELFCIPVLVEKASNMAVAGFFSGMTASWFGPEVKKFVPEDKKLVISGITSAVAAASFIFALDLVRWVVKQLSQKQGDSNNSSKDFSVVTAPAGPAPCCPCGLNAAAGSLPVESEDGHKHHEGCSHGENVEPKPHVHSKNCSHGDEFTDVESEGVPEVVEVDFIQ